ncbi:hypothetical protein GCM10011491_46850 [Brucella endophytica]|uniref:Uncharacterized protein n=1 Tax=Brucella endophytica TaxID=1963359 RepID=A0A916SRD8_9HYPH|nr:hypothetical protein [Brucella endophytica]GGB13807.1 hypothetical protein GCM10011491_46850 [Brucella endophytica]
MSRTLQIKTAGAVDTDGMTVKLTFSAPPPRIPPPPADGSIDYIATAHLTGNDGDLVGYWVKFHIEGGDAFFYEPDYDDETSQTATRLTGNGGIATANFGNIVGETQNMTATVVKDPNDVIIDNGASDTEQFTFAPVQQTVMVFPALDCAATDGSTRNKILAAVLGGENQEVDPTYSGPIVFTIASPAQFDNADNGNPQQKTVNATQGFAEATFTNASGKAETIITRAALPDGTASSRPLVFHFYPDTMWLDGEVLWAKNPYDDTDSKGEIAAQYQFNIVEAPSPAPTLYLCLEASSSAYFFTNTQGYVNAKVIQIDNPVTGQASSVSILNDSPEQGIMLTASVPAISPPASTTLNFGQS